MNTDRRVRLWGLLVESALGRPVTVEQVCAVVLVAAGVDRSAVAMVLSATPWETLYVSDPVASRLQELTLTLGEGPGRDRHSRGPILVADLASAQSTARWPIFAPAALEVGARAVFTLPLQVGAVRLGVLDLYRSTPGELEPEQLANALVLADTACALLLDSADRAGAPWSPPSVAWPERAGTHHPEVHQATGMITVQLGVTVAVALSRLRGYAYVHDRQLRDVAGDVVARRLRFAVEPDDERAGQG